jgi:hypothetical protein
MFLRRQPTKIEITDACMLTCNSNQGDLKVRIKSLADYRFGVVDAQARGIQITTDLLERTDRLNDEIRIF